MFKNKDYTDNIKLLNTSIKKDNKGYIWENDCKYSLKNEKYKIFLNSNFNFKDYLADIPFFLNQKINSNILSGRETIKLFYDNLLINFILIKKILIKLL